MPGPIRIASPEQIAQIASLSRPYLHDADIFLGDYYKEDPYFKNDLSGKAVTGPLHEVFPRIVRPKLVISADTLLCPPFEAITGTSEEAEPFNNTSLIELLFEAFDEFVDDEYGNLMASRLKLLRNYGREVVHTAIEYPTNGGVAETGKAG